MLMPLREEVNRWMLFLISRENAARIPSSHISLCKAVIDFVSGWGLLCLQPRQRSNMLLSARFFLCKKR